MSKWVKTFGIIIVLLWFFFPTGSFAHDDQGKHDSDLKYVLWGDRGKKLQGAIKLEFSVLSDAAALCIDQFSPNSSKPNKLQTYQELQENLEKLGLPRLSISFDSMDLNISKTNDRKNVTANTHRQYTHFGWNYKKYPNASFWQLRKQILLEVVNSVYFTPHSILASIPWLSNVLYRPNEQCDAFCALIYYVHILGDHIEGNKPDKLESIEPLIQYTSYSAPGIIAETQEYISILFSTQKTTRTYLSLMQELDNLCIKAEHNCGTWGSIDSEEKCLINQEYAKEFIDILSDHIPNLLMNENFFHKME